MDYFVHETARVDQGARIGAGTKIWHFCHVMPLATVGEHCSLGQNVFLADDVTVGNHVKIQNNVSIYQGVTLEDFVFCGPSMVFTNVRTPRAAYPVDSEDDYLPTTVRHGATIGANATVVCGITLGRWCFIAAGAVVTRDVPDFALMAGVPAKRIGWVGERGVALEFQDQRAVCSKTGQVYQMLSADRVERVE